MTRINTVVLMSDANHFSTNLPINPYYHTDQVDYSKAANEHQAIHDLLIEADIEVITVDSPSDSQDGVYTANWALVRGDKAVLARLPDARKAEEGYAREVLTNMGIEVVEAPIGTKFSGQGDALACGPYLFCGKGYRSDAEAQAFAAEYLGFERIQLETIPQLDSLNRPVINPVSGWPDSFFYDIDLALSVIKAPDSTHKGLIAYCPDAFTPDSRSRIAELVDIETIEVSLAEAQEAFACNLISTGEVVVMSAHAPLLSQALEAHGLKLLKPEITELSKGGGYIRCTTLSLN